MYRAWVRGLVFMFTVFIFIVAGASLETLLPSFRYFKQLPIDTKINLSNTDSIQFLDLGTGVAALLHTADGKIYLFDTGEDGSAMLIQKQLALLKAKQIDFLLLTSPKIEHMAGFGILTQIIPINKIAFPHVSQQAFGIDMYESAKLIPKLRLQAGQEYTLDKQSYVKVFHPSEPLTDKPVDESLVAQFIFKGTKILFTGDITEEASNELVNFPLESDILIVPNHAQFHSLDPAFLKKVNPKVAIITGVKKGVLPPKEDIVEQLNESWIDVYRTDRYGTITVLLRDNSFEVIRP